VGRTVRPRLRTTRPGHHLTTPAEPARPNKPVEHLRSETERPTAPTHHNPKPLTRTHAHHRLIGGSRLRRNHPQPDRVDEETTRQQLRRIVADLQSAEGRLRVADVDNLTYRKVFSALGTARELLRELDPDGD
jgi:hypothetical protein